MSMYKIYYREAAGTVSLCMHICIYVEIHISFQKDLRGFKKLHEMKQDKDAFKVQKWGKQKIKIQKENRAKSEDGIKIIFMKIYMAERYFLLLQGYF